MFILPAIILGLAAGLLVDYLADELPAKKKWTRPACQKCGSNRSWMDFFLLSRCKNCQQKRPWRTWLTLAACLVCSLTFWLYPPIKFGYWFSLVLITYLGLVTIIDIEHRLILHSVSLFGAMLALLIGTITQGFLRTLLGGLIGFVFMLVFYLLGVQFARLRARKMGIENSDDEALGFGDVTISGVLGLMMGFENALYGIITGILLAGLFSLLLLASLLVSKKLKPGDLYIPYGPFLIAGACVYIFFK